MMYQSVLGINGFCHFSKFVKYLFFVLQLLFMGLYQLSRLHYTFANDQIHSSKGYPKWLFIMVITGGIILSLTCLISQLLLYPYSILSRCGITNKIEYQYINFHSKKSLSINFARHPCDRRCLNKSLYPLFGDDKMQRGGWSTKC